MTGPPLVSCVAARHGIKLLNCDLELSRYRYCDSVLVMDTLAAPWQEFFMRAVILHPDSNWQLFALDYRRYFDVVIYGFNRMPLFTVAGLLKTNGVMVNVKDDICYKRSELEII